MKDLQFPIQDRRTKSAPLPPPRICTECGHQYSCWYQKKICTASTALGECGGAIKPDPPTLKDKP